MTNECNHVNLKNITVELKDFTDSIPLFEDKLKFLDPPYFGNDQLYLKNNESFDHKKLFDLIKNKSKWILTYNNSEIIKKVN